MTTRRQFLKYSAAATCTAGLPFAFAPPATAQAPDMLTAGEASARLLPDQYPETRVWGFGGQTPGPVLRHAQGERLRRRVLNQLPQPTAVHWHGIRIDNAMDGVPGLTQQPIAPRGSFDYEFVLPDAGTYWYHAHNRATEQVARGLLGPLIVDEPVRPEIDRDEVLILDDWRLDPENGQLSPGFDNRHDRSHAGRLGNYVTTNGNGNHVIDVKSGERLRLRLINASNARIFALSIKGLEGWIMALDGMPLEEPRPLADQIVLAPAQRADLFVDVTAPDGESAFLVHVDRGEGYVQSELRVRGVAARTRRPTPAALPPNPRMDVSGLETAHRLRLDMQGGAMGRMQEATVNGRTLSFRELAAENRFWAFNGKAAMDDVPLATIPLGETVRLVLANDTAFPHGIHLHGTHFRAIQADGRLGPMRDTILVGRGARREIAFVADNPGDWLLHCHMLSHADAGMMTWLRVG